MQDNHPTCPVCGSRKLAMKYEAKYVYTYVIDDDAPGLKNDTEFLPFLFDKREQTEANQYIQCSSCGAVLPCYYSQANEGFDFGSVDPAAVRESLKNHDVTGRTD
jgi:DNA-directed RNA polymerase subunit RPC12/RpoP